MVVLLIVTSKIVVIMHVKSCIYDKKSLKNSYVVVMHVCRGITTTLRNKIVIFTTEDGHIYNRCKNAGCRIAIYPEELSF